ncbi:MAG: chromate transporter [Clostridiaceae bacterium]
MKRLWQLFSTFFRIGAFTFGGGYAMLPILQREIVEEKKWATDEEVLDYYAIGQSTPGIIAINTATFVGYKVAGISGALVATIGMVVPSLIIIISIFSFFKQFENSPIVQSAFKGISSAVVALLIYSIYKMASKSILDYIGYIIFIFSFIFIAFTSYSPIWVVIASAITGMILRGRGIKHDIS